MDTFIEKTLLEEIIKQANRALFCWEKIISKLHESEKVSREIEHFIQHASAISHLLWNKNKSTRSSYLKNVLKINNNDLLSNRNLRNHLVHFDVRLENRAKQSISHNFIDQNIGNFKKSFAK